MRFISLVDRKLGWTVDDEAQVWRTDDGGRTWKVISKLNGLTSPFLIEQIEFIDSSHCWMVDPYSV